MTSKASQSAGDNASQVIVHGDYHAGLTEERAIELIRDISKQVIAEHSAEAELVAAPRIDAFGAKLVDALSAAGQLNILSDPAFYVLLKKAQLGAASTERESDHDMLASLLTDRAERGEQRVIRAGIDRAVQIVDQLDDGALAGLTVAVALTQFAPTTGNVTDGLDVLERLFGELPIADLPLGGEWIEHLDILDAARVSSLGNLLKRSEIYSQLLNGYVSTGLEVGTDAEADLVTRLAEAQVQLAIVDHELRPGFRRLEFRSRSDLDSTIENASEANRPLILEAAELFKLGEVNAEATAALDAAMATRPNLKAVGDWWDQIPQGFSITMAGVPIARANAKRCDTIGVMPPLH